MQVFREVIEEIQKSKKLYGRGWGLNCTPKIYWENTCLLTYFTNKFMVKRS